MNRIPTDGTAALAGIWSAFGAVPFAAWKDSGNADAGVFSIFVFVLFTTLFFIVPVFTFVIGRDYDHHNRWWFLDSAQRAKHGAIMRRSFCWFVSAGAFGTLWSIIFNHVVLRMLGHDS